MQVLTTKGRQEADLREGTRIQDNIFILDQFFSCIQSERERCRLPFTLSVLTSVVPSCKKQMGPKPI